MKFKSLLLLFFLAFQTQLFAVDRIVQDMGPTGTYATIGDAVAAASDGDRIVIYDRLFDWVEDVTVDKSLTITSASDTFRVRLNGDIIVAPAAAGKEVVIMRMDVYGNIEAAAAAPIGTRTSVTIVDSDIGNSVLFNYGNFDLTLSHCEVGNNVSLGFGQVLGNVIDDDLTLSQVAGNQPSNEVVHIIGNKIYGSISSSTNHYFIEFQNNFIYNTGDGIYITELKSSSAKPNLILNNSIYSEDGIEVFLSSLTGAVLEVQNNAMQCSNPWLSRRALNIDFLAGNTVTVGFNRSQDFSLTNSYSPGTIGTNTNGTTTTNFIDFNDGSTYGAIAIDRGNPEGQFFDHDLTRNDIGTQGGSYSIRNYFPRPTGNGPRVIYVGSPRIKLLGDPIDVSAEGFEK